MPTHGKATMLWKCRRFTRPVASVHNGRMNSPPKPKPHRPSTRLRHQELHDRLLQAATDASVSAGLANLRARSLAEAVGCSVGAIYGVFPDLDALVLAVNGATLDALGTVMQSVEQGRDAAEHLRQLALAYADYAVANRTRWRALFEHRMTDGRDVPDWYAQKRAALFAHVEQPLQALQPGLDPRARVTLARTVFSAVHGVIDLGLDEKLADMPFVTLREQIVTIVAALAKGLQAG